MKTSDGFYGRLVGLSIVLIGLCVDQSSCEITVTVSDVTAYTARVQWQVAPPSSGTDQYRLSVRAAHSSMLDTVLANGTSGYDVKNLDDLREYEACVEAVDEPPADAPVDGPGCATFATPIGASTSLAIASGVFLVLCFVAFGALDFLVSKKRNRHLEDLERSMLEEGWQTFKRNSTKKDKKDKKKKKKGAAPGRPRPDSSTASIIGMDSSTDVVIEASRT